MSANMVVDIAIFVEDKLLPPVQDILGAVIGEFKQVGEVELWAETTDRTMPVLVLGNMPPITPAFYVKTLSQKQILTNPAAVTELTVALTNLLTPPTFPEFKYEVVKYLTPEQEAGLGNTIVVDIETGGQFDVAIRPNEKYLLCTGIFDGKTIYIFDRDGCNYATRGADQLVRILTKPSRKLIAHNMKYDFPILDELLGISMHGKPALHGHFDTMLMHHSINHGAKEHDLKNLCHKYLGAPDWESDIKQYLGTPKDYGNIPPEILHRYNAYDVYWTWFLREYLLKVANSEADRIAKVALHEFRMSTFFQDVEKNGVGIDVPYLTTLREELNKREEPILARIRKSAVPIYDKKQREVEFNPGSWQQVKKHFNQAYGINLASTDEKHLMEVRKDEEEDSEVVKFIDDLLEYREIGKMRGTYVDGILKRRRGNIVYPSFLVHGTSTGRLSSKDPNIQNIPRDKTIRRLVVPRASGRTMVQADYSQAELRVMACLSGDRYLQSLFQEDSPDFFDALMPIAYPGIDLAPLSPGRKKALRAKLKGVIYGMSYGRQAKAIASSLEMPVEDAVTIMDNYFRQAPDLKRWREEVSEIALDPTRALVSPFGRQYQAEVVTSRNRQNVINSALAFTPQSTASDLCVLAAIDAQCRITEEGLDALIVATVHDAILLDVADEDLARVVEIVPACMVESGRQIFGDVVVFAADTKAGPSWSECG